MFNSSILLPLTDCFRSWCTFYAEIPPNVDYPNPNPYNLNFWSILLLTCRRSYGGSKSCAISKCEVIINAIIHIIDDKTSHIYVHLHIKFSDHMSNRFRLIGKNVRIMFMHGCKRLPLILACDDHHSHQFNWFPKSDKNALCLGTVSIKTCDFICVERTEFNLVISKCCRYCCDWCQTSDADKRKY